MTAYRLLDGVTAVQTMPVPSESADKPGGNLPAGSKVADLSSGGALGPVAAPVNQGFQLVVVGASPGVPVSATVQPLISDDGIHWVGYGAAISVAASSPSPAMALGSGTVVHAYYSAYVQAIAGTGAKVYFLMSA